MNEIALPELGLESGFNMLNEASPSPWAIPLYVLKKTSSFLCKCFNCSGFQPFL